MKPELQNKLLEKYAEILFEYWEISTPISPMKFGFECDDGWFNILDKALGEILSHVMNHFPLGFSVSQVKEKYGKLEIYLSHSDETLNKITYYATCESFKTCEVCGTKENIGMTQKWFKTICESCYDLSRLKKLGYKWTKESIYKNFENNENPIRI